MKTWNERIMAARREHDYFLRLDENIMGVPKDYTDRSDWALEKCIKDFIHYTGGQSIAFIRGDFRTIHAYIREERFVINAKASPGKCPPPYKDEENITHVTIHSGQDFFDFYDEYFLKKCNSSEV